MHNRSFSEAPREIRREKVAMGGGMHPQYFSIHEGRVRPCEGVPLTDRGFRYGMHLFETIAVSKGHWLFFREHLDSLRRGAREAGFSAPPENLDALDALPQSTGFEEGVVRVYWTAGDGSPSDPPHAGRIYGSFEAGALPGCPGSLRLEIADGRVAAHGNGWKTGNYWERSLILRRTREQGFDEALVVDSEGYLAGACMANAFFAMPDGRILTPPAGRATRAGVVRAWVLSNTTVFEEVVRPCDLPAVSAILLTNSRIGIAEGVSLGSRDLAPFPKLDCLSASYRRASRRSPSAA